MIMSDHSCDVLLKRGRCLMSYTDDKDKDTDDKDKDKVPKRPKKSYIFEKQGVQGYQI